MNSPQVPKHQQPTPEEVFDAIDREVGFARVLGEPVVVTSWLLIFNVVIYAAAFIYGLTLEDAGYAFSTFQPFQLVFYTGMKVNAHIQTGEWWRLLSSMFIHLNFMHIAFNGYGLFVLGPLVEKFYGARRFFAIYMLSGLFAALMSFIFNDTASAGASGAIYGLVGSLAVFGWKYRTELPERVSRSFTTGMAPWIIIGIGIGFFETIPFDNAAHIGGLLSGGVITAIFTPRLERSTRRFGAIGMTILTVLLLAVSVWTLAEWSAELTHCMTDKSAFMSCYPEIANRI